MSPGEILVIDDEPVVRDAVRRVLEADGWSVTLAGDLEAALALPALARCAAVVCDLMLPGVRGFEALGRLHQRRPGLPVILMSGYATREHAAAALAAGARAFVSKPFDESELLQPLREVLERAGAAGREMKS